VTCRRSFDPDHDDDIPDEETLESVGY